jgi:hypothetical protein
LGLGPEAELRAAHIIAVTAASAALLASAHAGDVTIIFQGWMLGQPCVRLAPAGRGTNVPPIQSATRDRIITITARFENPADTVGPVLMHAKRCADKAVAEATLPSLMEQDMLAWRTFNDVLGDCMSEAQLGGRIVETHHSTQDSCTWRD